MLMLGGTSMYKALNRKDVNFDNIHEPLAWDVMINGADNTWTYCRNATFCLAAACVLCTLNGSFMLDSPDHDIGKTVVGSIMIFSSFCAAAIAATPKLVQLCRLA